MHPGALLPLALPPHEGQYAPLVALARHLQQALLHLLASTTQHRSSTGAYFARCCAVLRVLFDAIMETTPAHYDNRTHVRDAFIRSHTLALVSALVDFANTRITTEASFVLLKHVVVRTPAEERTRLGMLRGRELPGGALCAEQDSPRPLELMPVRSQRFRKGCGTALVSRLQDLIHHTRRPGAPATECCAASLLRNGAVRKRRTLRRRICGEAGCSGNSGRSPSSAHLPCRGLGQEPLVAWAEHVCPPCLRLECAHSVVARCKQPLFHRPRAAERAGAQ